MQALPDITVAAIKGLQISDCQNPCDTGGIVRSSHLAAGFNRAASFFNEVYTKNT
ncbi:hypothetical protein ALC57_02636 [Trachymyrmex cornetzi]|uniref:Uncharacterized protein n=1 Tax=Trachymyrmex cornetzi TaxID=471704 RepID=A0A151JNC8_9HYME|nr:hypothetical protein ALC57_02636 [Trachymyrmex cornetzi]